MRPETPQEAAVLGEVVAVDAESEMMVGGLIAKATAGVDDPPPPPAVGLNTETCADPTLRISEAGMVAVSVCVVGLNVVWRLFPFHCTSEQGRKLLPVTLTTRSEVPAVALAGKIDDMDGVGSNDGPETAKLNVLDTNDP